MLEELLAKAKARKAAAVNALSEDDENEIQKRLEIAQIHAEAAAAELKRRQLELDRAMDRVRTRLGPEIPITGILIDGASDFYVVRADGKAHADWQNSVLNDKNRGKGGERLTIARRYALKVVESWNGKEPSDDLSNPEAAEFTRKLDAHLTEKPGQVTPITDEAARLAGVFVEERKSQT